MRAFVSELLGISTPDAVGPAERRANITTAICVAFPVSLTFALVNWINGFTNLALVELLAPPALMLPALLVSRRQRLYLAESLVAVCAILVFASLLYFGGIRNTGVYWVFSLPLVVFYIAGQRWGWAWSLAFWPVAWAASTKSYAPAERIQILAALFFYTVVSAAFNLLRSRFEIKLNKQVSERTEAAATYLTRLQHLAGHDELTGFPNRVGLMECFARWQKTGHLVEAVLYVKFLRLAEIANIIGSEEANALVQHLARQIVDTVSSASTVGCLGRDEFVIFLSGGASDTRQLLEGRLRHGLQCQLNNQVIFLEPVTGVCLADGTTSAQLMMRKAEQAMLTARASEQSLAYYDERLDTSFIYHHQLFHKLGQALEKRQFTLHFQGQVNLQLGTLVGAEILIRWKDPEEGFISPAVFIPIAEQSGLIAPITRWVIENAIAECARWHRHGHRLTISINLSARNLIEPSLFDDLVAILDYHRLAPQWVNLELTESAFLHNPEHALNVIQRFRRRGFRLSIDDFGTGYSSLSYLKNLPVHELKIDQSFVSNINSSMKDDIIVSATSLLARQLKLDVVAEGVEDAACAERLRAIGCTTGQGYFFCRPQPEDVFFSWLATNPAWLHQQ
jgi:EAL domain-containing protein (putative c-di-GMP-specific phosphodiesterase class I)/GGDEF domain-containing protein